MKSKIYIAILSLMLSFGAAHAQKGGYIGVNYTVNAISMTDRDNWGSEDYNYLLRIGHAPGLILGYNFTRYIGVHTEVNYAWMGAKTENFNVNGAFDKTIKSEYIQVPILLNVSSGQYASRFVAMIGPQMGFLTAAHRSITGEQAIDNQNIKSQMNGFDIGLLGHLGGEFRVSKRAWFTTGLRGYYGFTNVNKDGTPLLSDIPGIRQALNNVSGGVNVGLIYFINPEVAQCKDE